MMPSVGAGPLIGGGGAGAWPVTRMGEVFVIAAVSALDAGLLAAAIVMLGRPHPARQLLVYLIGGMGFSITIGLVIMFALHSSSALRGPDKSTRAAIAVAAGALLIVIAAIVLSGRCNGIPAGLANATPRIRRGRASPTVRWALTRSGSRGLLVPPTAGRVWNTWPA
jgi:hypothetical protein